MKADPASALSVSAFYLGAALLSIVLSCLFLHLWDADLRVPFAYGPHDELTVAMTTKSLIEGSGIFHNPHLGMPFGADLFNYPQPDVFHLLVLKLLALTTRNFGIAMNLFYLLTFPLTLVSSIYVLRQFGIGYGTCLVAGLLYTFLPYHFLRGEEHLFLAAYYSVPLVILLGHRVASEQSPFVEQNRHGKLVIAWRRPAALTAALICALAGSSGVYYAFFGCFLILTSGIIAAIARRRAVPAASSLVVTGLIVLTLALCLMPHLLYHNRRLIYRGPGDAETYGLKVTQMLLPVSGHRLKPLALLKNSYAQNAPLINENETATFGLVASAGFIFLAGWIAFRALDGRVKWLRQEDQLVLSITAILAVAATALGTIGGFGSLIAFVITSQIRSYNRISIFIAFLAFLAIGLLIDRTIRTTSHSRRGKVRSALGLSVLAVIGLFDETSDALIPNYDANKSAFSADRVFVRRIEESVEPGAMIFQLPYQPYPDAPRYDLARGYLHSRTLKWSYGAMRNERSDLWQRDVAARPITEMVEALRLIGFSGIYLDRRLSDDNGAQEQQLTSLLGPPIVSAEAGLSYFILGASKTDVPRQ